MINRICESNLQTGIQVLCCNDQSGVLAQQLDRINHMAKMPKPKLLVVFHKALYISN